MELNNILQKIFTVFVLLLLFWFIVGLIRWFQRDDLQFAIGADPYCLSFELSGVCPDKEYYVFSIE